MNLHKYALTLAIATVTTLVAFQPANALLKNTFEFTDNDGNGPGRISGQLITGEITFNTLNTGDSATDVAADSIIITSIPDHLIPNWGDSSGFQINQNILGVSGVSIGANSFDLTGGIVDGGFFFSTVSDGVGDEIVVLSPGGETWLQDHGGDGNTNNGDDVYGIGFDLQFSATSAAVPFEFSPSLGLILTLGGFSIIRIRKNLFFRKIN